MKHNNLLKGLLSPKSLLGIIFLTIIVIISFSYPLLSNRSYANGNLDHVNLQPILKVFQIGNNTYSMLHDDFYLIEVSEDGQILGRFKIKEDDINNRKRVYNIDSQEIVIDYDLRKEKSEARIYINGNEIKQLKKRWNKSYPLGTDTLGRDILTRVIYGLKNTLTIAFFSTIINLIIGTVIGITSGYFEGTVDGFLMRFTDGYDAVPKLVVVILFLSIFPNGRLLMILSLGIIYWISLARIVRNRTTILKQSEFVIASKSMNANNLWIFRKHILINLIPYIITLISSIVPSIIFGESTLGFIGLGINPPIPSLGLMISNAVPVLKVYPYQLIIPSTILIVLILSINFIGDSLQESMSLREGKR